MNSFLLRLAVNAVRGWTWLYTWRMPPGTREARRAEIESDLWEFQRDTPADNAFLSASHILLRLLLGIPDDLGWRLDQAVVRGTLEQGSVAFSARVAGAALFVFALWVIDVDASRRRPIDTLPRPAALVNKYGGTMRTITGDVPQSARGRNISLLTAGIVATVGMSMQPQLTAQSPPASNRAAFEAASIKSNKSGEQRSTMVPQPGGRFTATNVTVRMLIRNAYQVPNPFQITGEPDWVNRDRFDVLATAGEDVPQAQVLLMLQALLAERFKLWAHYETRNLPVYELVMARNDKRLGPQLRRTTADCAGIPVIPRGPFLPPVGTPDPKARCGFFGPGPQNGFSFRGMTMEELARFLEPSVSRLVTDKTGLTGHFDVDLPMTTEFGPPPPPPGLPDAVDRTSLSVPSTFTAIQEQLGLKLESATGPVEVLVIDGLERPTPD